MQCLWKIYHLVMFSIGDDFDVDEDFLDSAFAVETKSKNICSSENGSASSSPLLQDINKQKDGHNNVKEANANKNDEFVNLWNSRDEELFFSKSPPRQVNPRNLLDVARAESPIGFKSKVVTRTTKNVLSRKFPGPAGLLPERTCNTSFIAAEEYISKIDNEDKSFSYFEEREVLSQATSKLFEEPDGAWTTMMEELGTVAVKLTSAINLSTIRLKQARFGFKVPFLAVCVHNIDCSLPDPSLLLKDQMDEMHGTLHRNVWEDWKSEIIVGSVLVLRNIGVVTAGMSSRRYFLNITANNIVTIYTPKNDSSLKISQIQSVSSLDSSQLLEEWERVMSQTRQQQVSSESQVRPLFNTFSPQLRGQCSPGLRPAFRLASPANSSAASPAFRTASPAFRTASPASSSASPAFRSASPAFRSASPAYSPASSAYRSGSPAVSLQSGTSAPLQRPSPMRPAFRPRPPPQPQKKPPLGSHNARMPLRTSNSVTNPSTFTPRVNIPPQRNSAPKPTFILKTETFKAQSNPPQSNIPSSEKTPVPASTSNEGCSTVPAKKAKIASSENEPVKAATSTPSIFTLPASNNKSALDSALDGIDTDLFFDDF